MKKFYAVFNSSNAHNLKKCETKLEAREYAAGLISQGKATSTVILESIEFVQPKEVPVEITVIE